eukprot:CAMPEP_0184647174 /NCGR_PEP_ID=MMETSP0308-20130426/4082_1 /TAXON_ID=38269 /ORGANISM="Gloeochaete witrockiana, Strain SAG 46.84" /LENGTH=447 /DNA_ID=CAMNT_0027077955 /DNA_START=83 /DNA_END=1427 /DNA_ORIENTATION=-
MKIAVVGGGLAGLTACFLLSREGLHDVVVYERAAVHGIAAESRRFTFGNKEINVDVPVRSINDGYYEDLTQLIRFLGGVTLDEVPTFSTHSIDSDPDKVVFSHRAFSLPFDFYVPIFHSGKLSLTFEWKRLHTRLLRDLKKGRLEGVSFGEYLQSCPCSQEFRDHILVPMLSLMLTCPEKAALTYPADLVASYMNRVTHGKNIRVAEGVGLLAEKLSQHCKEVRLNARIKQIIRKGGDGSDRPIHVEILHEDGAIETYDHVILATQPHHALALLGDNASEEERRALSAFHMERSTVIMHTDTSYLPKDRRQWAAFNYVIPDRAQKGASEMPQCTVWMNKYLKGLKHEKTDLFQTWNPFLAVDESKVLSRSVFDRPVLDATAIAGMRLLQSIQGQRSTSFCGAYALYDMPLLENAVRSSVVVARRLGATVPWKTAPLDSRLNVQVQGV